MDRNDKTMVNLLIGLRHQPNFPREDLLEDNADVLEMLLSNLQIVEQGHVAAESASWLFTVGHPVASRVGKSIRAENIFHIDIGIRMFEAISTLISTPPERVAPFAAERTVIEILHGSDRETEVKNYGFDAVETMVEEVPIASGVVRRAAERHCGHLTTYALLGAALIRQFELDCLARPEM